ncbi:sucrase ferredoxin [Dermatophilaceae bacterium Soc4.6]
MAHGRSAPDACSVEWDGAEGETAWGTAAPATFWVALEQNGPWGRTAVTQSRMDPGVGRRLERGCAERGGRLTLLRAPGEHAEHPGASHRVFLGWTGTASAPAFLLGTSVSDPSDLDVVDLDALARGDRTAVVASLPSLRETPPVLIVCTNGRRDVCCAVRGRPVALAGHWSHPGRVWECSHTGGHRFSPTGVLLPWGRTLGRLDDRLVTEALRAADDGALAPRLLGPWHDRGSSALPAREQVAESAVRALLGETRPALMETTLVEPAETPAGVAARVEVGHPDGRRWHVDLRIVDGHARRNSCGEDAVAARTWGATVTSASAEED